MTPKSNPKRIVLVSVRRYQVDGKPGKWTRAIKVTGDPKKLVIDMQHDQKIHAICIGYEDSTARRILTRGWEERTVGT